MRRHNLSNSAALKILRPRGRQDWQGLLKVSACFLLLVACVAGLLYNKKRQQAIRERSWASAVALVEDARPQLAMHIESQAGGVMLYRLEILARYPVRGGIREQWTTISQQPQPLADAQLQAYLLKGKQCIVRWKPDDPKHITADID